MKRINIFLTISIGLLFGCQTKQSSYNIELLSYYWKSAFQMQNDSLINKSIIYRCPLYVKIDSSQMASVCFNENGVYYFSHYKISETLIKELIDEIKKIPRDTTFCPLYSEMEQPRIYDGPWIRLRIREDGSTKNILITDPEEVKGTALLEFYRSFGKVEQFVFDNYLENDTSSILKSRKLFINSISNTEITCTPHPKKISNENIKLE